MSPAVPPISGHAAAPPWPVLQAPPDWRNVDFISDLHLQPSEAVTFSAWQKYMETTRADAVFILGDLFEVWVGDDVMDDIDVAADQTHGFEACCAQVLKAASQRLDIFFMHGNRDFLLGPAFAQASGMTLLGDPSVLDFGGQRWLLSHGDALCLLDTDYMQFRAQVRSAQWQQEFLAKPLAQRQLIARALRTQSETRKHSGVPYADLDFEATCDWLRTAQASTLIHGHTHKPANHDLSSGAATGLRRIVLSDWDAGATPPRAEVLRISMASSTQPTETSVRRIDTSHAA
ncbi:UDP-2,3-diacylglucosamine diphosphatase [Rhodoferax sp. UBA5149]|uniref:UDP-2,3-diacylglucosamine diphosphatase n=1 Tax=Rhodoferax sp. UBA5149 TaxID=1947379 RepID=UPI0025D84599|nr:UDP-2,3-diacylglucosamine diphosphatase [Rhodoferax sp. UBA5149]